MLSSIFSHTYSIKELASLLGIPENVGIIDIEEAKHENHTKLDTSISFFINGYRQNPDLIHNGEELPDTKNKVFVRDVFNYWEGLDALFSNNLNTPFSYYADGHFSVATSNHQTIENFIKSLLSSLGVAGTIVRPDLDMMKIYHKEHHVQLNTLSNESGFSFRLNEGRKAGEELINKVKKIKHTHKIKINIISHSMGFAYSMGIIEKIKEVDWLELHKFFVIAPENAKAAQVDLSYFQEIWQYGSREDGKDRDKLWEQDGMAPQSSIFKNDQLDEKKYGRIFIPKNYPARGFIYSHLIKNYNWIFSHLKKGERGFVC